MPLSISPRDPRRAPTTDTTAAYAATTNVASKIKVPRDAILRTRAGVTRRFVLRRTLRDDVGGVETVRTEFAGQHDFGLVVERVRHDAGVPRVHDIAGLTRARR